MVMTVDDFNNVLRLMAAIIFADKHVYDSEVSAFVNSASQLNLDRDFNPNTENQLVVTRNLSIKAPRPAENDDPLSPALSRSQLSDWYETNKNHIRDELSTPFYKDWFYNLLDQLSDLPNKETILSVMRDISMADGKVHINERALITLAERHWGLR